MQLHEYATQLLLQHLHSHCGKFTSKQFPTTLNQEQGSESTGSKLLPTKMSSEAPSFLCSPPHVLRWWNFTAGVLPFAPVWRLVNVPSRARCAAPWSAGPGAGDACSVPRGPASARNAGIINYQFPRWGQWQLGAKGLTGCSTGLNLPADHTPTPGLTTAVVLHILQYASVQIHAAARSTQQTLRSYLLKKIFL